MELDPVLASIGHDDHAYLLILVKLTDNSVFLKSVTKTYANQTGTPRTT